MYVWYKICLQDLEVDIVFIVKTNEEIGNYIEKLIAKKFPSKRKFCQAYLKLQGISTNDDETRKMANRISQITNGKNSIQTTDFPYFTELLGVTCEQILSCGSHLVPRENRPTNYLIAFSKNRKEWEQFLERDDKLILNEDEYCKTAIDYAIEYGNYDFLKFLIEKGYIWFDSRNDKEYYKTFGAGTRIERRRNYRIDNYLQDELLNEDYIRLEIISLALKNDDFSMLDKLRAREIPEMYYHTHYSGVSPGYEKYYNNDLVSQIAKSSNNVVEYFTEEFEINNKFMHKDDDRVNTFMYPYISELLDKLIQNNHPYMEFALKNAINHSQKTLDFIKDSITDSIESTAEIYKATYQEDQLSQLKISFIDKATEDLTLYDNCHAIKYFDLFGRTGKGITTTIACVSAKSNDASINRLINELNSLYDRIKNIKNEFIKES